MIVKKYSQLDKKLLEEVNVLYNTCEVFDKHPSKMYWPIVQQRQIQKLSCDFLCYESNQLIGYLGLFAFSYDSIEVCAFVHPEHRQNGVFIRCLMATQSEREKWGASSLTLPCHQNAIPACKVLQKLSARYVYSEYALSLVLPKSDEKEKFEVGLTPAGIEDVDILAQIDHACFNTDMQRMRECFTHTIADSNRATWLAVRDDTVIGKMHVRMENESAIIHDFAILPKYQGKGFGTQVLKQTLLALSKNNVARVEMEVSATNKKALNIYQRCGFDIKNAFDFWRV